MSVLVSVNVQGEIACDQSWNIFSKNIKKIAPSLSQAHIQILFFRFLNQM